MTADLLALLKADPAAGILAVAEIRERRANAAAGPLAVDPHPYTPAAEAEDDHADDPADEWYDVDGPGGGWVARVQSLEDAEHIAAEANPAHALAAVRRWRGVVERHTDGGFARAGTCVRCIGSVPWPCPDLQEVTDEAKAYLGDTS